MDNSELMTKQDPYKAYTINEGESPMATTEKEERLKLQWKDILAIILAVYRVFLPWALAIAGIYFFLFLLYDWIF